jgi:hypothetical protein
MGAAPPRGLPRFKAKPAFLLAAKPEVISPDLDDFSGVVVCPLNEVRPRPCAGSGCPLSDEPVEVQLQPILQANSLDSSGFRDTAQVELRAVLVDWCPGSGDERGSARPRQKMDSFQNIPDLKRVGEAALVESRQ